MGNHPIRDRVDAEAPMRELLPRRLVLGATLAGLAAFPVPSLASSAGVMVVYVFADDCAPCHLFQTQDWPLFRSAR